MAFSFTSAPAQQPLLGQQSFGAQSQQPFGMAQSQPAQNQAQQAPQGPEAVYAAALRCSVFGDDRDALLARWNLLQGSWGSGKIYYSKAAQPIVVDGSNPLCRFKAMGYSKLPNQSTESEDISLIVKMSVSQLEPLKDQMVTNLNQILGNKPNVKANVVTIRTYGQDNVSEVVIFVTEEMNLGMTRKVPGQDIFNFFNQPNSVQALQKMNVERVLPKPVFSSSQIQDYYDQPPLGIDPRLWQQAQMDNPNPDKFLPVPLLGFKALQGRVKSQESQAKQQTEVVKNIGSALLDLKKRHQAALAKMVDVKRKHFELAHRVLQVIVKQETTRKLGFAIQYEEEKIGAKLEQIQQQLLVPTQFKGRISELLSQMRFLNTANATTGSSDKFSVESFMQCDIHHLLKQQQQGISALVEMTKQDICDLQQILE